MYDSDNLGMASAENNRSHTNKGLKCKNLSFQKFAALQSKAGTDSRLWQQIGECS